MSEPFSVVLFFGSIQTALDQPLFPGKVVIWAMLMLSIVSWVMILSKAIQLLRIRNADKHFSARLRQSRTTLELFEEGWRDDYSAKFIIYLAGARETAFQLLGSRNPSSGMSERIVEAGRLSLRQCDFLKSAFGSGFQQASMRLSNGFAGLRFIAAAAFLLGLMGGVWTLMTGFDAVEEGANLGPVIGSALGFVMIALFVATPALLGRIAFSIQVEKRIDEVGKFRDDLARLFERKFVSLEDEEEDAEVIEFSKRIAEERVTETPEPLVSDADPWKPGIAPHEPVNFPEPVAPEEPVPPEAEPLAEEVGEEPAAQAPTPAEKKPSSPGKKQYHSIRERLLRPPEDDEDQILEMNPIARQAVGLRVR
ncbi:MAG: MotA/TolQ/ExbB proton channel family protein [Verrucomicrobiota bacterium]